MAPHPEASGHWQGVHGVHAVHGSLHGLGLHCTVDLLTHLLYLPVHLHLTQLEEKRRASEAEREEGRSRGNNEEGRHWVNFQWHWLLLFKTLYIFEEAHFVSPSLSCKRYFGHAGQKALMRDNLLATVCSMYALLLVCKNPFWQQEHTIPLCMQGLVEANTEASSHIFQWGMEWWRKYCLSEGHISSFTTPLFAEDFPAHTRFKTVVLWLSG